jgi:hypothetical protein
VKIRGTAAHIAEKYMSLARDALASGDMVGAESYLQHAEHYNRIIMAAQSQMSPQHGGQHQGGDSPNGAYRQPRWNPEGPDDEGDLEMGEGGGPDIRAGGGDGRQGGGRDDRRHGGNGRENARGENGSDQPEPHQPDDTASDPVS